MKYVVLIERGTTGYGAYVPDLPGCVAAAATEDEVRGLIREAIALHLEGMREDGAPVPPPVTSAIFVEVAPVPKRITIRGVSDEVRGEIASRAARKGQSMEGYLRGELERIASKPDVEAWLADARALRASGPKVTADEILQHRDADRK